MVCICATVRCVDNRTAVTVLQHPRERFHAIGTARIARLGLKRVRIETCAPWENNETLLEVIPPDAALLYPVPGAESMTALEPAAMPRHLVVLDGTWFHAKKIYDCSERLRRLRAVTLPDLRSDYRIRREPRSGYVSTIEAIVAALRIAEPDTEGLGGLLTAFGQMIDRQLEAKAAAAP